jgi:hypothetical protein
LGKRALCNVSPSPGYTLPEFCLAMHMCNELVSNPDDPTPDSIDDSIVEEVQLASGYVDPTRKPGRVEAGASRPWRPKVDLGKGLKPTDSSHRSSASPIQSTSPPVSPRVHQSLNPSTSVHNQSTGVNSQPTIVNNQSTRPVSSNPFRDEPAETESSDASRFAEIFNAMSTTISGQPMMSGTTARDVFMQFNVGEDVLAKVWDVCSKTVPGHLSKEEFVKAMVLTEKVSNGSLSQSDI